MVGHILMHAFKDVIKLFPFLLITFVFIEGLNHRSERKLKKILVHVKKAGPIIAAVAGCLPQCGFSVMAANLYASDLISLGTLLSVFIAISDEAVLILIMNPGRGREVVTLLATKMVIAIIVGYMVDLCLKLYIYEAKTDSDLREYHECYDCKSGFLKPALHHTICIFLYLFLITMILNLGIELIGEERLYGLLLRESILQPLVTAFIGLIPNCASSILLGQLYLKGTISFASVIAGLCAGSGVGMLVLFKINHSRKESLKILALLYGIAVLIGMALSGLNE